MSDSLTRLDLTQIFCDVDDFYKTFEHVGTDNALKLPHSDAPKQPRFGQSFLQSRFWVRHRGTGDFRQLQCPPCTRGLWAIA